MAAKFSGVSQGGGTSPLPSASQVGSVPYALPFFRYLSIPKNTEIASPLCYVFDLPFGTINRVWVEFPRGCSGLVGVRIMREVQQLFPLPDGVWLASDNVVLDFAYSYTIASVPSSIEIQAYNHDDTYPHSIWIGLEMRGIAKNLPPGLESFISLFV